MKNNTFRILAADHLVSNDTWATGINNNDLIIGPSGSGKTRSYVKPNILQCNESIIVADTKGSLIHEVGPVLKRQGYQVINIDFTDMLGSYGYNPLDYIRYDQSREKYVEQDIMSIANCLAPVEDHRDPFWDHAAAMYLASMIGYVLECLPDEEHTLEYVAKLFAEMREVPQEGNQGGKKLPNAVRLFQELGEQNPDSFAYKKFKMYIGTSVAEKMHASILGILARKLDPLVYDGPLTMYKKEKRVDFSELGRKRTAVFLTISDTDRSADCLVNLFYTQAIQSLCRCADRDFQDHRLPVPVRLILDDFATNACIPDFDNIISVIRSREIYVSVIIQSISQLNALYGADKARTIINNCDNLLYLGGQDVETAQYVSIKANRMADTILNMPLEDAYLFTRGKPPEKVKKFDLRSHKRYRDLPEAAAEKQQQKRCNVSCGRNRRNDHEIESISPA